MEKAYVPLNNGQQKAGRLEKKAENNCRMNLPMSSKRVVLD